MPNKHTQRGATTPRPISNAYGFSLPELMIVIVIIAILLAIGIPSYQYVISSNRISYEVNDLRSHIELARSEAQKRGLTVLLCPSSDGSSCNDSTDWTTGWIIYTTTGDCTAAVATVIKARIAFGSSDTAVYSPNNAQNNICFTRTGLLSSDYSGYFSFNTSNSNSSFNRCISVSTAGRARVLRNGEAISTTVNCS